MQIVSATAMRERGRDGQFWKRFALGSAVGYVYAVFGLALTFAVLGVVGSMIRYPPDGVFSGVAAFVLTVPHILVMSFIVGIFMGLAPMLTMLPVAAIAALGLQTRKAGTFITGAVLAVLIGGPVALGRVIENVGGVVLVACYAGAGAMFALALWKFCLRHYNASGEKPGPGRFGGWWRGRSLVTKLAMAAGAVVFIALFGL